MKIDSVVVVTYILVLLTGFIIYISLLATEPFEAVVAIGKLNIGDLDQFCKNHNDDATFAEGFSKDSLKAKCTVNGSLRYFANYNGFGFKYINTTSTIEIPLTPICQSKYSSYKYVNYDNITKTCKGQKLINKL